MFGRCIPSSLSGKALRFKCVKKTYLLACKMTDIVNGQTIAQFAIDCLTNLWGNAYDHKIQNILIMCTDSVGYIIVLSAGRILKRVFPNMKNITCLPHALLHLHLICICRSVDRECYTSFLEGPL